MKSEYANLIVRMDVDLHRQIKERAAEKGTDASKWARELFLAALAKDGVDPKLKEIMRLYQKLNDEGKSYMETCAKLAASNKEMRK